MNRSLIVASSETPATFRVATEPETDSCLMLCVREGMLCSLLR